MPGTASYQSSDHSENWIHHLKTNGNSALKDIYLSHRSECIEWLKNTYRVDEEIAKDTFQVAIVLLYQNVVSGKLKTVKSSLKSYLFAIAKNKVRDIIKSEVSYEKSKKQAVLKKSLLTSSADAKYLDSLLSKVKIALEQIGDPCKSILELFYFDRMPLDEIAQIVGHNHGKTTKSKKHKCLKRLQKLISTVDLSHMQYE